MQRKKKKRGIGMLNYEYIHKWHLSVNLHKFFIKWDLVKNGVCDNKWIVICIIAPDYVDTNWVNHSSSLLSQLIENLFRLRICGYYNFLFKREV